MSKQTQYVAMPDDGESASRTKGKQQQKHSNKHQSQQHHQSLEELDLLLDPMQQKYPTQTRVLNVLNSLPVQVVIILLILADMIIMFLELGKVTEEDTPFNVTFTIIILSLFVVELLVRIWASAPTNAFFSSLWSVGDGLVVLASFIITVFVENNYRWFTVLRVVRCVRIIVRLRSSNLTTAARSTVSQNKRRYVRDGFDLDLTYITPRVIGMSAPSEALESIYRNPIGEVARFFNTKHPNHYRIYDTRAEYSYDPAIFDGRVVKYPLEDHNVAPLRVLLEFCENARSFVDTHADNVIAVHCRGGKGRTGTLISSWLLYDRVCTDADEATKLFGTRRTDTEKGSAFQGIETPSQNRYVGYFQWIVKNNRQLPPTPTLTLTSIRLRKMPHLPNHGATVSMDQIYFRVLQDGKHELYNSLLGDTAVNTGVDQQGIDLCTFLLNSTETIPGLPVSGDIKIHFYVLTDDQQILVNDRRMDSDVTAPGSSYRAPSSSSSSPAAAADAAANKPKGITACYLWFHTFFIQDNQLHLDKSQIDRAARDKKKMFDPEFALTMNFE